MWDGAGFGTWGWGGMGGWAPATTGYTPGAENETMRKYLAGGFVST